jgi:hypothetical protein
LIETTTDFASERFVMKHSVLFSLLVIFSTACISAGRDFPAEPVSRLEVGKTTQDEARSFFGSPWRTGMKDGDLTWTYGEYRYWVIGASKARDLVLRFDEQGVLAAYTYDSTERDR